MIILDTHIWIWWVSQDDQLSTAYAEVIIENQIGGLGVSAISCWEVAKLVEKERLKLRIPVLAWIRMALAYPGIHTIELSPEIVVTSTQLPGDFHRDPADQIIVATAMELSCPLVTADKRILDYGHVKTL